MDGWSKLGFGTWKLGGRPPAVPVADQGAFDQMLGAAVAAGINWFDTAGVYGLGAVEERLGSFMRQSAETLRVMTKCGVTWHETEDGVSTRHDLRPETIQRQCVESLHRLRTNELDVLLLHWPDDAEVPVEESWGSLGELQEKGLVKEIGVSNFAVELLTRCHVQRPVSVNQFKLSPTATVNADQIAWCANSGTTPIAYEVFGSGPLLRDIASGASNGLADAVRAVSARSQLSNAAVLAAWALNRLGTDGRAIVGASSPTQIEATAIQSIDSLTTSSLLALDNALLTFDS